MPLKWLQDNSSCLEIWSDKDIDQETVNPDTLCTNYYKTMASIINEVSNEVFKMTNTCLGSISTSFDSFYSVSDIK